MQLLFILKDKKKGYIKDFFPVNVKKEEISRKISFYRCKLNQISSNKFKIDIFYKKGSMEELSKGKIQLGFPNLTERELLKKIKKYPLLDYQKIRKAIWLAKKIHKNQKRYGGSSYLEEHIFPIASELINYLILFSKKLDSSLICSAILHDCLEDDETGYLDKKVLLEMFDKKVSKIVSSLTKKKSLENYSKLNRDKKYFKNLMRCSKETRLIKLIDRYHNILTVTEHPRKEEYLIETFKFILPLAKKTDFFYTQKITFLLKILSKKDI
jgi:(p)ppGpp synthase/HD superfamily hydrolase